MDDGEGPRAVLEHLRRASIDQSAGKLADLYAVDAVHEFPFRPPGVPERLEGREQIMSFITAGWRGGVPKYDSYRTIAVHETGDPHTLVVEQEAVGVSASGRPFALPNIVVLTVANGRIAHLRDYVDVMAAMSVIDEAESPAP